MCEQFKQIRYIYNTAVTYNKTKLKTKAMYKKERSGCIHNSLAIAFITSVPGSPFSFTIVIEAVKNEKMSKTEAVKNKVM